MQGPSRWLLVTGLLIGCSGDDTVVPESDAPVGAGGLVVDWSTVPSTWPGTFDNGLTIERATFALDSLRVVGDAGPGDPRTTASALTIRWDESSKPVPITFVDAPTGLYSQLSLLADGHLTSNSFELCGHAMKDGTSYEYRIEGDNPLTITVGIDKTLTPPATTTVALSIDFKHALEDIDFSAVDIDSGRLDIDDTDPQMAAFRAKLVESFSVEGQSGTQLR